jgi:hypothetical protein
MGALKYAAMDEAERLYALFKDHFQITGNRADMVPRHVVFKWIEEHSGHRVDDGHLIYIMFYDDIEMDGADTCVADGDTVYLCGIKAK